MKPITVLLADDNMLMREGFRRLLVGEADIKVVGEAKDGLEAIKLAKKLCPEVVVMDISMPLVNGLEATRLICETFPVTKVLILSVHSDIAYVKQAIDFGAVGYLIKHIAANDLCPAIREAHKGNAFFSPSISKEALRHFDRMHRK